VEMGIRVHPATYQDQFVEGDIFFETREVQNYIYTVVRPDVNDLNPTQPWAQEEWLERIDGIRGRPWNPGKAWFLRKEIWREFLDEKGFFAYTYSDRFSRNEQVRRVIDRIEEDPDSRQLFISIWDVTDIEKLGGISRIPCTLGYQIQIRKGALNITYLQRSCDLATHFVNDVFLAHELQRYLAMATQWDVGTFTHWIGSLHLFKKDSEGVF